VNSWRKAFLASCLNRDGVIAYPTEGVWGLGCLPDSSVAVAKILALKRRSWEQGLLLVAANKAQFSDYLTGLGSEAQAKLDADWPGPMTYLVPDNGMAPGWIVGTHDTLGLRVSAHPVVAELCETFGPLVSTSANVSGRPAAMSALAVHRYFGSAVDALVPGALGGQSGPSQIKVLETGEVVR
jgi:L-threonylcarbamoyladenylate synthase